jgi:hypothetical protein
MFRYQIVAFAQFNRGIQLAPPTCGLIHGGVAA